MTRLKALLGSLLLLVGMGLVAAGPAAAYTEHCSGYQHNLSSLSYHTNIRVNYRHCGDGAPVEDYYWRVDSIYFDNTLSGGSNWSGVTLYGSVYGYGGELKEHVDANFGSSFSSLGFYAKPEVENFTVKYTAVDHFYVGSDSTQVGTPWTSGPAG